MRHHGMQLQRAVRLAAVQIDRDRRDGDVRQRRAQRSRTPTKGGPASRKSIRLSALKWSLLKARPFYANAPAVSVTSLAFRKGFSHLARSSPLDKCGGKEAVGAVAVWPKPQPLAGIERDALAGEQLRAAKAARNSACRRLEIVRHGIVLLMQDAAGRINQPAAGLHQRAPRRRGSRAASRRARRSPRGPWRHLRSGLRRSVPKPLHGASTSTRSSLPASRLARASSSPSTTVCTLVMPARAARGAERSQPLGRNVHRVDAARCRASASPRKRLAAGAGAVVGDHLAAPRRKQPGEQLAALVLHFDQAVGEQRVAVDRRLAGEAQPAGEYGVGFASMPSRRQPLPRSLAVDAREIDAQVERRRIQQSLRDAQRLLFAVLQRRAAPTASRADPRAPPLATPAYVRRADAREQALSSTSPCERARRQALHAQQRRGDQRLRRQTIRRPPRASACGATPRKPFRRRKRGRVWPRLRCSRK